MRMTQSTFTILVLAIIGVSLIALVLFNSADVSRQDNTDTPPPSERSQAVNNRTLADTSKDGSVTDMELTGYISNACGPNKEAATSLILTPDGSNTHPKVVALIWDNSLSSPVSFKRSESGNSKEISVTVCVGENTCDQAETALVRFNGDTLAESDSGTYAVVLQDGRAMRGAYTAQYLEQPNVTCI